MGFGKKKKKAVCPKCNKTVVAKTVKMPNSVECFLCVPCDTLYRVDEKKGIVWLGTYTHYKKNGWID
jgi:transcription elongation factor Elf1